MGRYFGITTIFVQLLPSEQGRCEDFGEGGALSGAERQIVPLVARVRRREAPPIEQWQGSGGAAPGGGLGAKPPTGG